MTKGTVTLKQTDRFNLETESIWPLITAAVGPDYGIGNGVEVEWRPSHLEEGLQLDIPANYGTNGSKPNYKGLPRNPFYTGTTSQATAIVRSLGRDPGPLPADVLPNWPEYQLLPYGAWYNNRIPSVNKAATFGNDQTVELYGYSAEFQAPQNASLLAAVL